MMELAEIRNSGIVTLTAAMKAVDESRDQMNLGREKIVAPDYSCVAYFYEDKGGAPCSIGYKGRSKKAAFHYRHRSETQREEHLTKWMNATMAQVSQRKRAEVRELEVGDVLVSTWGYDQTNVDFYMVTKLVGKQSVELVEIGQMTTDHNAFGGSCVPDKSKIVGEPLVKRVAGTTVRIDSCRSASKAEPQMVAGVAVYRPVNWTSGH